MRTPALQQYACDAQVTYACDADFVLIGQKTLTCGSDGQFNFGAPSCIPEGRADLSILVVSPEIEQEMCDSLLCGQFD